LTLLEVFSRMVRAAKLEAVSQIVSKDRTQIYLANDRPLHGDNVSDARAKYKRERFLSFCA
jgi:hypothetical protein